MRAKSLTEACGMADFTYIVIDIGGVLQLYSILARGSRRKASRQIVMWE